MPRCVNTALVMLLLIGMVSTACNAVFPRFICTDPLGCQEIPPGNSIVIGAMFATSGDYASIGVDSLRAATLASEDAGSIHGHPVSLDRQGTDCTELSAQLAATALVTDPDLIAVIGPTCDAETPALPILDNAGIVSVSLSIHAASPTGQKNPAFNLPDADCRVVKFLSGVLTAKRLVIIAGQSAQGEQYWRASIEHCSNNLISSIVVKYQDNTGMVQTIDDLVAAPPDAVFLVMPPTAAGILVKQIRSVPVLKNIAIAGSETLFTLEFLQAVGDADRNVYLIGPDFSSFAPGYIGFVQKYWKVYGQAPSSFYSAFAYDAMSLLLAAIEHASIPGRDGTLFIPRSRLRMLLHAPGPSITLTNPMTCDHSGICFNQQHTAIYQFVNSDPASWNPGVNPVMVP